MKLLLSRRHVPVWFLRMSLVKCKILFMIIFVLILLMKRSFGVFEKEFSSLDRRFDASARAEKDLSVVPYESFVKVFTEHVDASLRDAEAHNFPYDVNDAAEGSEKSGDCCECCVRFRSW